MTKSPVRTGLAFLLLFFIASLLLIAKYAENERQRDMFNWQSRLGVLADMHKAAVESWLYDRNKILKSLADNPTLQLYLSQYESLKNNSNNVSSAQLSHVKNLMHATAKRFNFYDLNLSSVNVEGGIPHKPGLAVFSKQGKLLFTTKGFTKNISAHQSIIATVLKTGNEQLVDMFTIENKYLRYGYVMPVFHIQKMQFQEPVGAVMVLIDPKNALFGKLQNLHLNTKSDETLLLRLAENSVIYISPLRGVFNLLHQMPKENINLAANIAVSKLNYFSQEKDYRNKDTLFTSRKISGTPWVLMQKIDAIEALEESNTHQYFVFTTFTLLSLFIVALFIAVWRHGTSVRLQKTTNQLESQTALLNTVTDNINEHIFLIDESGHFVFSNVSLSKCLKIDKEDFMGKSLSNIFGPGVAEKLQSLSAGDADKVEDSIVSLLLGDNEGAYHIFTERLQHGEYTHANLFVLHDVSRLKTAQDKRDSLAKGIIKTLVKAVDLYDPFCVDHSERTREVAIKIAHEIKLDKSQCDCLEMSSLLANIGKLFVPKEILTKMDALSDEENNTLRKHIEYAVDILQKLEFEGPVVKIISQKNENLDGSGYPEGLKGDEIMLESRILAVANAFVAMASSRAYRKGRAIKEVMDILLEQTDTHYDRKAVAALFHIVENNSDWGKWKNINQDF